MKLLLFALWVLAANVHANEALYNTRTGTFHTLAEMAARVTPGTVVLVGEQHATEDDLKRPGGKTHHENQVRLLHALPGRVSVGMEFLEYTVQNATDGFVRGDLDETEFLKAARWGTGNPFEFYREQILFPRTRGGRTLALNIPRQVARSVGRLGRDGLTADEIAFLPPLWERGSSEYFARFEAIMGGHVGGQRLENMFMAQSLWDDTMAWKIAEHMQANPDDIMAVIVGEFHVDFGHGLPARVPAQGWGNRLTILQVRVENLEPDTRARAVQPDARYGARADWIWLHE